MIVVADSSPLIVLVKTGDVHLLPQLFDEIAVPSQIHAELTSTLRTPEVRGFYASPPEWLRVHVSEPAPPFPGLHAGESAAIRLASTLRAAYLLLDERKGRAAAVERGLVVLGTVGIFELAAINGLCQLAEVFDRLKATDFWYPRSHLDARLKAFREQRTP